jgi:predicted MFS family arabinose efflux permease
LALLLLLIIRYLLPVRAAFCWLPFLITNGASIGGALQKDKRLAMILNISRSYRDSFSGLSRDTWLLSIVMLVNRASTMVVPFMSMYLTQSMHKSIADAGIIITLFGIGSVIGSAAGGYFIDKVGFRSVQIFTAFIGGGLFMLFGQINNFPMLCVLTLGLSIVADAFRPANIAAIAAFSSPENLTRSYSLNRLAQNLGWGFGSSLGGILAAINYHLLFWVEGCAYILIGILVILLLPGGKKVSPAKEEEGPLTQILEPIEPVRSGSPWKDGYLLRFMLLVTVYTTCFILVFRLVPVYWKESLHINESMIGLLMGLNGIIIALFEMVLVRYWESRRAKMYYVISGVLLTACGFSFLVLPGQPSLFIATGMIILITVGEMLAVPFMNTIVMSRAGEGNRGKYSAVYALSWSVAQIAGPGGGALIVERWGYITLWIIVVLLCLGCAFAFKILLANTKRTLA